MIIAILCFTLPIGMQAGVYHRDLPFDHLACHRRAYHQRARQGTLGVLILPIISVIIALLTFISPFAMFFAIDSIQFGE